MFNIGDMSQMQEMLSKLPGLLKKGIKVKWSYIAIINFDIVIEILNKKNVVTIIPIYNKNKTYIIIGEIE